MDPTSTLEAIRFIVAAIEASGKPELLADLASDLAELVSALDKWMGRGGFLPMQWARTKQ